jgi:hypothetical protein
MATAMSHGEDEAVEEVAERMAERDEIHVVALDAERVLDNLGGSVGVVAYDRLLDENVLHVLLADDLDRVLRGQISNDDPEIRKSGPNMVRGKLVGTSAII